jgi:hypothetical protein
MFSCAENELLGCYRDNGAAEWIASARQPDREDIYDRNRAAAVCSWSPRLCNQLDRWLHRIDVPTTQSGARRTA